MKVSFPSVPVANCDERSGGELPSLVVVHAISLPPDRFGGAGVEQLFTNRLDPAGHPFYATIHHLRVSAHYFIRRDGELICFVPPEKRAWHAGVSSWRGRERCNDFSVGIELEGCDSLPFEGVQYAVLAGLLVELCARFPVEGVVGHSDIAPGRKTDPGPYFSWGRLRQHLRDLGAARIAVLVEPGEGDGGAAPVYMRWPFPLQGRPL